MASFLTFGERFQHLLDLENLSQADAARALGFSEAMISKWLSGKTKAPFRKTLLKISNHFKCDIDWLESGDSEPFQTLETAGNASEFEARIKGKERSAELSAMTRLRFKMQCGSAYFDEFFDFIADEYGENREGAELFLQWVHDHHADYRRWLAEKKHGAEGGSDKLPITKSANGNA